MTDQVQNASPQPKARITGAVYLSYFLTAIFGQLMVSRGFAASGNVCNILSALLYAAVTLLFYALFKPVSHSLSLIAALFSLAGCVFMSLGLIHIKSTISPLWFFGPFCLLIGYLILRSTFLPRTLGVLMAAAGAGWLAYLIPALPLQLSHAIMVLGFVAELTLCLWLLIMGVNVERWKLQDGTATSSVPIEETPSALVG